MNLKQIISEVDQVGIQGNADLDISGICCNSHQTRSGYLFVAIPGNSTDGWLFVNDAVAKGAVAVISEHREKIDGGVCHIQVKDAHVAFAYSAAAFHGWPHRSLKLLGITGTNGKTTVSYLLRDVLSKTEYLPGLIGTIEYQIGSRAIPALRTTPDAVTLQSLLSQMVSVGCKTSIMEVSSHGIVQKRIAGLSFDIAIFTNLSRDHLDYHHTMDEYYEAKAALFTTLPKEASAVINSDDSWGRKLLEREDICTEKISFGLEKGADVKAENVRLDSSGSSFVLKTPWGDADMRQKLMGRFNISNSLAVVGCCGALGVPLDTIVESLSHSSTVCGRLEEICTKKKFQVFVDYAHTDDALKKVLTALREITCGKLIVVFGCGGDRDRTKRPAMGEVAEKLADYVIVTSDNPRKENPSQIIENILEGFSSEENVSVFEDREEAIRKALMIADDTDIVLIAGKGHEKYQQFAHKTIPFDDCAVVKSILSDM